MRRIKFRAWFKVLKRMYLVKDMKFQRNGNITILTNNNGGTYPVNYELMQFTGLKDKNGKEIYEGDIIYMKDNGNRKRHGKILVKFENCEFFAEKIDKEVIEEGESLGNFRFRDVYEIEVMGNMYENPELLSDAVHATDDGGKK